MGTTLSDHHVPAHALPDPAKASMEAPTNEYYSLSQKEETV